MQINYWIVTAQVEKFKIKEINIMWKWKKETVKNIAGKAGAIFLSAALLMANAPQQAKADYIRGKYSNKKAGNEIIIKTAKQFNSFARAVTDGQSYQGKTVKLGADIKFTHTEAEMAGGGKRRNAFEGTFDGNGYTISGMKESWGASLSDYVGLFSITGKNAVIKNVIITNAKITSGKAKSAGILVGYNQGFINNCKVVDSSITTTNSTKAGGVAGECVGGKIYNCMNMNTDVLGKGGVSHCGGIVASMEKSEVYHCGFTGNVEGRTDAGGIAGFMYPSASVTYCYSAGSVSSTRAGSYSGGLMGRAAGTVSDCYYASDLSDTAWGTAYKSGFSESEINCKSSNKMASAAFAKTLNKADKRNSERIPWVIKKGCNYPQPGDVYAIGKSAGSSVTITCKKNCAYKGKSISFSVSAKAGQKVKSVTVKTNKGKKVVLSKKGSKYQFKMPASPVVIQAK